MLLSGCYQSAESGNEDSDAGNMEEEPQFVDGNSYDFHLTAGSPMIDTGAFLTVTSRAGQSISLRVQDARTTTSRGCRRGRPAFSAIFRVHLVEEGSFYFFFGSAAPSRASTIVAIAMNTAAVPTMHAPVGIDQEKDAQ